MKSPVLRRLKRLLTRRRVIGSGLVLTVLGALGVMRLLPDALTEAETQALYETPLAAPDTPLRVFHLGHSLVGRDMPVFLQQLAPDGHDHQSQLGWGTPMRAHWEPAEEIGGFETENAHPNYRDAKAALASGDYDAVVLTEMVEIRAAIAYFDAAEYLAKWAEAARAGRPDVPVYLYETWHRLDDEEGWLTRLDLDLERYWEAEILRPALALDPERRPIHVIPAGQVLAAFVREIETKGRVPDLDSREDLFNRDESGALDTIHVNDIGAYLVALTHFAVLYHQSPVGLPHELIRADGSKMATITPETARLMQEVTWSVVSAYAKTGIASK